jgi:hypothetical protein
MITKEHLTQLLNEYPLLHAWGYGAQDYQNPTEGKLFIEESQPELFEKIDAINLVIHFLEKHATETKRITKDSSYYWKHVAEKALDDYIENGVFIAGALLAGYRMKPDPGYNPCFNMKIDPTKDN